MWLQDLMARMGTGTIADVDPLEALKGGFLKDLLSRVGGGGAEPAPAAPRMQLSNEPAQGPAATDQAPLAPSVPAAPAAQWTDQAPVVSPGPSLPAMPVKDIGQRQQFGAPYTPAAPVAEATPAPNASDAAPPTAAAASKRFEVGFGDRLRAFGKALQGGDPGDVNQAAEVKNQTMDFLISRGAKPEEARALVSNPTLLQQVLPGLVGAKQRSFGVIGEGVDGGKTYGFIDTTHGSVTPYTGAGAPTADAGNTPGAPPPPPGVNPVEWRKQLAKQMATSMAEARASLPKVIGSTRQILATLESIESDPSLPSVTGAIQGRVAPYFEASEGISRVMSKIEQTKGQAFLQAFESMRGGGAITNVEGDKATAAISRLQNLRQGDQDYLAAIKELRGIVQRVAIRTQRYAQGLPPVPEDAEAMKEIEARLAGGPAPAGGGTKAASGAPPKDAAVAEAKAAIARGADPDQVRARLSQWGYSLD